MVRSNKAVVLPISDKEKIEVDDIPEYYIYYLTKWGYPRRTKYTPLSCVGLETLYLSKEESATIIVCFTMKENYPPVYKWCLDKYESEKKVIQVLHSSFYSMWSNDILSKRPKIVGRYYISDKFREKRLLNFWDK